VRESSVTGRLRRSQRLGGLFEVDEAALPSVMSQIRPNIVLLTNLFRDQLDRYGELATTADRWRIAIQSLPETTTLILNSDDPLIASLADAAPGPVAFYGISSWGVQESSHVQMPAHSADSVFCPMCGEPLEFTLISYAHLGHYDCPACDFKRPEPSLSATVAATAGESSRIAISSSDAPASFELALPGRYNVYNAIAAVTAAVTAGVPTAVAARVVGEAPGAFGRAETILVDGRIVRLFLIKNPTGADEVFRVVAGGPRTGTLVVLLSDNAADGEDVSWTWDAQFDLLMPWSGVVICGGTRAEDMAVRLKYAGHTVPTEVITHDIPAAVRRAIQSAQAGQSVTILATYTAMLAARSELARGGYVEQYWQKPA
jgi:UDP-N-acetylmuramyl tripeptide synthase